MNRYAQQWLSIESATAAGLNPYDLWLSYAGMGGSLDPLDVEAYLYGLQVLPALERDLVAHAINEMIEDCGSAIGPAPYSTGEVSAAAGYHLPADGWLDPALSRLGAAGAIQAVQREAELRRLESLGRTGLLNTPAELRFDRITNRARQQFGVSSSSIALISRDDQFIKSLAGPIGQNLPREITFCNQTIRADRILVVPDALEDAVFSSSPLVQGEPHIRFYAGHPLTGPGGWRIGTLCIIDDKPRTFSDADADDLKALAALVQQEIDA
ncbi:GAF domain-containing protein [Arthrobacter sp. TMN-37]